VLSRLEIDAAGVLHDGFTSFRLPADQSAPPTGVEIINQQVAHLAATQPDVTLLLDGDGVIQEVTLSQAALGEQTQPWLGRPWAETLTNLASDQVRRFLADAADTGVSAFGPVTQAFPSGLELPMEYTAVRLGKRGSLLAVGKCVQAVLTLQTRLAAVQSAREQDYWRLREVETRYRLLFDSTNDAVLMLQADTLRVVDANPAALRSFGFGAGHDLLSEFGTVDRAALLDLLSRVRDQGRVPGILVHMGAAYRSWTLRATLSQTDQGPAFLLQFTRVGADPAGAKNEPPIVADAYIDRLPDGFLIIDRLGLVRRVNPAFVEMTQGGDEKAMLGQNLGDWLQQPGLPALLSVLDRSGVVRALGAKLVSGGGALTDIEISAAGNAAGQAPGIAMIVRSMPPAFGRATPPPGVAAIARLGAVPLNQLVQEATEAIEHDCIEAALAQAGGNRSAAAVLLGMSRQSLYVKLHRYGLLRFAGAEIEAD
jgi:transcriptional regulator PpsR